jgi:hypothetical protein
MKTKTPTRTAQPAESPPPSLITADGIAAYVRCRREWWLAEVHELAPGPEAQAARASLLRRQSLAHTLTLIGGGLIALAILLVATGLLLG